MKQNKILLITGASSEVGTELIWQVEKEYDVIWAHYCHDDKRLLELRERFGEKIRPVQADFGDPDSVRRMIGEIRRGGGNSSLGGLAAGEAAAGEAAADCPVNHIVHLAAPKLQYGKFAKCGWGAFEEGIRTCLQSVVEVTQAFLPQMAKNKYGRIVFMLSSCTQNVPPKYLSPYVTVKYALLGLMKSLAAEYAEKGITVNGVSPDMMETKFLSQVPELIVQKSAQDSPRGRNLTVQEVVPAFVYLLSDQAAAVTGANLEITGGR